LPFSLGDRRLGVTGRGARVADYFVLKVFKSPFRDALILIFAGLGALGPFVTFVLFLLSRRKERANELEALHAIWSLQVVDEKSTSKNRLMLLRLDDPDINRFRVVGMRAKIPRSLKLANTKYTFSKIGTASWEVDGDFDRSLVLEKDSQPDPYYTPHGIQTLDRWSFNFYASVPDKPWFVSRDRTRLAIRISVEERSSRRVQRYFIIKSQPTPLTNNNTNNAK
jgi:hypothetical protein